MRLVGISNLLRLSRGRANAGYFGALGDGRIFRGWRVGDVASELEDVACEM